VYNVQSIALKNEDSGKIIMVKNRYDAPSSIFN